MSLVTRWLSNTLWAWGRSLRRTRAVAKAQDAHRRAALRGHTQGQHKALVAAQNARNAALRREAADRLVARQCKRAEVRERNEARIIWPRAA